MLRGSNSLRVIVLAALVLAVALSSTVASHLAGGNVALASAQLQARSARAQKANLAWQAQLQAEQGQLQQAQQQQAAAAASAAASAQSTLTPAPTPTPTPQSSSSSSSSSSASDVPSSGTVESIIEAAFASQGSTAQQWGLCIAYHESGDNPSAVQSGSGGAEGLFQFEPSTWARTAEGEAGASIFDATAQSEAAATMYSAGEYDQWTTNADYCSAYD